MKNNEKHISLSHSPPRMSENDFLVGNIISVFLSVFKLSGGGFKNPGLGSAENSAGHDSDDGQSG